MNGLLSIIGMKTEMEYQMGDFAACFGDTPLAIPKGNIPSDKRKCQPKEQHEFTIKHVHQLQNLLFGLGLNSEMEV